MGHREILDRVTAQIPQNMTGVERQQLVGRLVADLPAEDGDELRGVLNGLLAEMAPLGASDMDIPPGGLFCG